MTATTPADFQCRWGGPATDACWNVGACGCYPSTPELVLREAYGEQASRSARAIFDAVVEALRIRQLVGWLDRKIARP